MPIKNHTPITVCPSSQIKELGKLALSVRYRGEKRDAILIRFKGTVYGYLNRCVHMPRTLDCEDNNIFDDTEHYLRCSMHGICYDPVSGESQSELCAGKKLTVIKVKEEDGWVYLIDKKTDCIG
ncbi:MAG: Rieske 2Fe-2S domain-containing protein [Methylomonas sp.]|jgi:nitrite reductase/ring-hydroxylating ferredoxin subunit